MVGVPSIEMGAWRVASVLFIPSETQYIRNGCAMCISTADLRGWLADSRRLECIAGSGCYSSSIDLRPDCQQAQKPNDARVVLVMTDGMRWQEIFRGADESSLTKERYYDGRNVDALRQEVFLRGRRKSDDGRLMPFLWGTFIPQGKSHGDRDAGSDGLCDEWVQLLLPGYSETLTGHWRSEDRFE